MLVGHLCRSVVSQAGIALSLLLSVHGQALAAEKKAVGVIASQAQVSPIYDEIEALGNVFANESVTITPKLTEKIVSIHFDDGQIVKRGSLLVQLDDSEEQANLRSELAILVERESAYRRVEELFNRKVGSEADLDAARARVDQTKSDIEAIRSRISAHRITAPFDGVVGLRAVSEGALVEPADPLTTLDDLSVIKVDFSVPVVYLSQLGTGLKVEANTSAHGDRVFSGELKSLSSRVDPVTRTVTARAWFSNPERALLPGMLMQIELQTRPRNAMIVPESAVFAIGRQHYVFAIENEDPAVAKRREVVIGTRKAGQTEIVQGLDKGAFVVSHGLLKVSDGTPVKILAVDDGSLDVAEVLGKDSASDATP